MMAFAVAKFSQTGCGKRFEMSIPWGTRPIVASSTRSGSVEMPVLPNAAYAVYAGVLTDSRDFEEETD